MKRFIVPLILALTSNSAVRAADTPSGPVVPDYSQEDRSKVPESDRWRLEDIYPSAEAWRADLLAAGQLVVGLNALPADWTSPPPRLAEALELREKLLRVTAKITAYASFQSQVEWSNAQFQNMMSQANQLQVAVDASIGRLEADLLGVGENRVEASIAAEPRLRSYAAYLRTLLRKKTHVLPEEAEQVASQVKIFSNEIGTAAAALRDIDMPTPEATLPGGSKLTLDRANWRKLVLSPNAEERKAAAVGFADNQRHFENTFAALLDMSVKRDLCNAKIHHFPDCMSAEFFPYDVDPAVYRNLVGTVRGHLEPRYRFLRLRKKILGLKELHPYDDRLRVIPGPPLRFGYEEAQRLVRESTAPLGPAYAALVRRAFEERWIDVYGHKDKMNMGSASSVYGVHPFISLDFRGSFFDLITVTHELGHALSFQLAEQAQPFASADLVWFASEVPSTFNEILLMKHLVAQSGDNRRKLALLSEFLERLDLLLFFEAQHADLQLALHEQVEKGGTLSPEWLNAKQLELERLYSGHDEGVMVVDDYVASGWNHPSAFFSPFQSYFYIVGAVTSLALADKVQAGGDTANRYLDFLRAGSSRPILDVLKETGVDLSAPQAIEDALAAYDNLVGEMEALYAKVGDVRE